MDGSFPPGLLGDPSQGLRTGRLAGFSPQGFPLIETADGAVAEARTLVALAPTDAGADLAWAWLGGPEGTPLVLGLLRPPAPVVESDEEVTTIQAKRRVELRCGPASLTLFADGRVEVRGTQILSRADGAHRLQGGSVHLN